MNVFPYHSDLYFIMFSSLYNPIFCSFCDHLVFWNIPLMFKSSIIMVSYFFYQVFAELVVCVLCFVVFSVQPFMVFFLCFLVVFAHVFFVWIVSFGIFLSSDFHVFGRDWLSLGRWIVLPDFFSPKSIPMFFPVGFNSLTLVIMFIMAQYFSVFFFNGYVVDFLKILIIYDILYLCGKRTNPNFASRMCLFVM